MANNFTTFLEKRLHIKVVPKKRNTDGRIDKDNEFVDFLLGDQVVDVAQLEQFRTVATDRETKFRMYDEMCLDAIIASALEMYADDATQYNSKGQIIWAESEDLNVTNFANRLIDVLGLNDKAWSHIYSLVKYGDVYLELFYDDELDTQSISNSTIKARKPVNGSVLEEYADMVSNPAEIFDLTQKGKTVGFAKTNNIESDAVESRYFYNHIVEASETEILPSDKYIHITLSENAERFPEKLTLTCHNADDVDGEMTQVEYTVKSGKSILHDIYKSYKELKLMEDSLLLNRVTRSSIIRLLQVEVGEMPKTQIKELLRRIKTMVEQKNYIDKEAGTFQSMASPGPIDNVIYVPTKDGKGNITASNIGGDVDIKSVVDIDYFKNKFFGGLKIPKQFLGDTDDPAGFSGGSSLTKLDSRYARTIKRIQNAYISGITTLINVFALSRGLPDHVNNFTIKMVSPSTVEDTERNDMLSSKLDMIGTFMGLMTEENSSPATRKEMLCYFINNYLNEPEIATIFMSDDTSDKNTEIVTKDLDSQLSTGEDEESEDEGIGDFGGMNDFDSGFGSEETDTGEDFM